VHNQHKIQEHFLAKLNNQVRYLEVKPLNNSNNQEQECLEIIHSYLKFLVDYLEEWAEPKLLNLEVYFHKHLNKIKTQDYLELNLLSKLEVYLEAQQVPQVVLVSSEVRSPNSKNQMVDYLAKTLIHSHKEVFLELQLNQVQD